MITTFWTAVGSLCSRPIIHISNSTQPSPKQSQDTHSAVLYCPTTKDPYCVCISQKMTASEMYALCFWAWPCPKATSRPIPQLSTSSPAKTVARVRVSVLGVKVSEMEGKKEEWWLLELFLDREYLMSSDFSNSVFLLVCQTLGQIFSRDFRSP